MKHVVFGTAGHIDHGKSALVMALTGTNPDRLEEEKTRGITIDLGFAHLDFGHDLRVAFVDVPGHERFVRNMLAGATGIDAVILTVAADESIKPQTREHFEICRLLGIPRGLVALTKCDLVDPDVADLVRIEIHDFTAGSFLEGAPVLAVSVRTGEGLDALKTAIYDLSQEIAAKPANRPFRLPIDRAFVIKGFGTVVTGTLIAGQVKKEEELEIFPIGRRVRVRGIEVHNQPAGAATAGQRTALNLAGIDTREVHRGMVLARPGEFRATDRLDCLLQLAPSARPLKHHARVHFHCWTQECLAEVALIELRELKPGERGYAQLRLEESGLLLPGDRFIIRQLSPAVTMGGGTVVDNLPNHAPSASTVQFLKSLEQSDAAGRLELLLRAEGEAGIAALAARAGWRADEVLQWAEGLAVKGRLLVLGNPPAQLLHADAAQALSDCLLEALSRFHIANPLVHGMAREELRGQVRDANRAPSVAAFNATLLSLVTARKIRLVDEYVSLAGHEIRLTPAEQTASEAIAKAFEDAGLRVPSAEDVLRSLSLDRARAEKILQILLKDRILVRVAEGLIFHCSALESLRQLLSQQKALTNRLTVPEFKQMTGVSRKYAIPLLEYLDGEGLTRRSGSDRIIL